MSSNPTHTQVTEKTNCEIHIDCYGGISIKAPTTNECITLFKAISDKKQKHRIMWDLFISVAA